MVLGDAASTSVQTNYMSGNTQGLRAAVSLSVALTVKDQRCHELFWQCVTQPETKKNNLDVDWGQLIWKKGSKYKIVQDHRGIQSWKERGPNSEQHMCRSPTNCSSDNCWSNTLLWTPQVTLLTGHPPPTSRPPPLLLLALVSHPTTVTQNSHLSPPHP